MIYQSKILEIIKSNYEHFLKISTKLLSYVNLLKRFNEWQGNRKYTNNSTMIAVPQGGPEVLIIE